jgi:hypothetical protein
MSNENLSLGRVNNSNWGNLNNTSRYRLGLKTGATDYAVASDYAGAMGI